MLKSGLIVGAASFIFGFIATIISPLCAPCVALFAGLAAGYLAGMFDKPADSGGAAKAGAGGGAIAGVGALIGGMIASVINVLVVGPQGAAELMRQLGLDTGPAPDPVVYYASAFGTACCIGLFNIALMAGLGALGSMLWRKTSGNQAPSM